MKLFILQPYLYSYRKSIFDNLSRYCDLVLAAEQKVDIHNSSRFEFIQSKIISLPFGFHYQTRILNCRLIKSSDFVWIPLDVSNISYLLVFFISIITGCGVIFHTQGNYSHKNYSLFRELLLKTLLPRAKTTFYYSDSCFVKPFTDIVHRYHILNNRYECMPVPQCFSPEFSQSSNLLFIGRLRERSGILSACSVIDKLVKDQFNVVFHIIGNGPFFSSISSQYRHLIESKNIIMHGSIDEYFQITTIARKCSIGLYLGDAGLSVLHYMSLGLCPLIHDNMTSHKGPEPSYLIDNVNGKLVDSRDVVNSAIFAVRCLLNDRLVLQKLQKRAFADARSLHAINMSSEIFSTLSQL